ncbi:hypothetical protein CASFOL_027758 [Castilleja foliolosa]|uniref:F-box domain-containing protein n=1 Tax=Castilleja foliolosa TaxID=1961234 RepID=A0ABD3CJA0_9LAMI
MPSKRERKNCKSPNAAAMDGCILPQDMMDCIITRLPVKSIHRFKSVCKPLRQVFSSPKFAKTHRAQFSQNLENQSVLISCNNGKSTLTISLLKIKEKKPTKLDIPFPQFPYFAVFIGCCNGLLCMAFPGQLIALWNPALNNMVKRIPLPNLEIGDIKMVSLGLGYNEEADDFTVVRIVYLEKNEKTSIGVGVYSANSNSWSIIDVGFQFIVTQFRNDVIVNGNPYWEARVNGKLVLVCFDVRRMVFKIVPLPNFFHDKVRDVLFVDLNGDLGALVCNKKNDETVLSLDVWVFDDVGNVGWAKNRSFGPIEVKVHRFLQCLENGKILVGEGLEDGKLFVFDTESGGVKEIMIDGAKKGSFEVHGYTESLTYIKGMKFYDKRRSRRFSGEIFKRVLRAPLV